MLYMLVSSVRGWEGERVIKRERGGDKEEGEEGRVKRVKKVGEKKGKERGMWDQPRKQEKKRGNREPWKWERLEDTGERLPTALLNL